MTFDELRNLLRTEALRGDSGIDSCETAGPASVRVHLATVPGRSHTVWIAHEMSSDGETVRLVAPAARIPKGRELTADAARALLRRNAQLSTGAIALVAIEGEEHIALVVPLSLGAIEPTDALLAILRAANAADGFEETLGGGDEL
jgi:hypothetical protein